MADISKTDIETPLIRIHFLLENKSYIELHLGIDDACQFMEIVTGAKDMLGFKGQQTILKHKLATLNNFSSSYITDTKICEADGTAWLFIVCVETC